MTKIDKVLFIFFVLLTAVSQFSFFDGIRLFVFSVPAAFFVVGPLSGGVFSFREDAAVILTTDVEILMPSACSGLTFFLMLCLLFCCFGQWKLLWLCYPIAIAINGLRILLVVFWMKNVAVHLPLPLEFQHQTVGLVIFLLTLLSFSFLFKFGMDQNNSKKGQENSEQKS